MSGRTDDDEVHPEELVRGIAEMIRNPVAWSDINAMLDSHAATERVRELVAELAEERARNIVAWILAEFEPLQRR